MSTYAIGDLQGCANPLERLLDVLRFDAAKDRLWLVGDLVNRGPESLRTLRLIKDLGEVAVTVLGNHDLHLLALACGVRRAGASDTLSEILDAPDAGELIDWLRTRPLVHAQTVGEEDFLMVHAGVLPAWSASDALARAREVEAVLGGADWKGFMACLYGDEPSRWSEGLAGYERLRFIVNSFTRLRFCDDRGVLDLKTKEGAGSAPNGFLPWFDWDNRQARETTIVFGHWSTLGLVNAPHLVGLDTGCVWGGA